MTIHYNAPAGTTEDDEESLSPSDGYFGSRSAGVPSTMFVSNQPNMDKAQEALHEQSTSSSPVTSRSGAYTPQTNAMTPASSQADSGSVAGGYSRRYRDGPAHTLLEDDDAPPQYSETSTTGWSHPSPTVGSQVQYRDEPNTHSVREASTPFLEHAVPGQYPAPCENVRSRPVKRDVDDANGRSFFSLPACHKKRHGWRESRHENKKRKFKRAVFVVLVTLIGAWLVIQSTISHHRHRGPTGHRHPVPPGNGPPRHPTPPPGIKPGRPPGTSNRKYVQHEGSSSVSGTYHLYDLLDLSTTSGSVSITIVPEPAAVGRPVDEPAELRISTNSGSININMYSGFPWSAGSSQGNIPPRTYRISLSTSSGGISGSLLLGGPNGGGTSSLTTKSGSISVSVYPLARSSNATTNELHTQTNSGSQTVTVKSAISTSSGSSFLDNIIATHTSFASGSLNIKYPDEWQGIVHTKSYSSGSVRATGRDLEYGLRGAREVYAWRGRGDDLKTVSAVGKGSGSIGFVC